MSPASAKEPESIAVKQFKLSPKKRGLLRKATTEEYEGPKLSFGGGVEKLPSKVEKFPSKVESKSKLLLRKGTSKFSMKAVP